MAVEDALKRRSRMANLNKKTIAILATHGYEQSELRRPLDALSKEGATVRIVAPDRGSIRGWNENNWDASVDVDETIDTANVDDYDALVLPGGVMNPDKLRQNSKAVAFVKQFFDEGKPVAAICHAPWLLIEADVVRGRKLTSYGSIRKDLENAGAKWVDEEVVVDQGLVTSRKPDDLDAFIKKTIEEIREGVHAGQHA
jgi:protease I